MSKFLAFLLLLPMVVSARTFTSTDGKNLEADLVAANDSSVFLRRQSDQRDFRLPLERLSDKDRQFVTAWRQHLDHPLEWRRLRLHADGQTIVASCLPIYGPLNGLEPWRTQSNDSLELTLPIGAWVLVGIRLDDARIEGLVRYDGAPDWHLSAINKVLTIRRTPNGAASPAVAQGDPEAPKSPFSQSQKEAIRAGATLAMSSRRTEKLVLPKASFSAAHLNVATADWSTLPTSLRALQLTTRNEIDLAGIERFSDLEFLSLDTPALRGLERLGSLPKLRALYLKANSIDPSEPAHLGKLIALRHLNLNIGAPNTPGSGKYDFLASHTKLESLALSNGPRSIDSLDPALLRNCPNLTRLEFIPRGPDKQDYLKRLPFLTDLSLASIPPESALALMLAGQFKHLHTIRGATFLHPLHNLPSLRILTMGSSSWPLAPPAWDAMPFLERLHLRSPSQDVLENITSHRAFQTVRHLSLDPRGPQDLTPLARLSSLRALRIESHPSTAPLDLTAFPALESLEVHHSQFPSIPTLKNLRALSLDCGSIQQLGDGTPTRLKTLEILGSGIPSLDGIRSSPALHSLLLADCRNLASLSGLDTSRQLSFLHLSNCPKLPAPAATR